MAPSTPTTFVDLPNDGIWVEESNDPEGFAVCVKSRMHPAYQNAFAQRQIRARRTVAYTGSADDTTSIDNELIAEYCLLNWKNFYNGDVEIPYSKPLAFKLMTERRYSPFQDFIRGVVYQIDESDAQMARGIEENLEAMLDYLNDSKAKNEDWLTEAYREKGMEVPSHMLTDKEMPVLDDVEMLYWNSFQELQSERPIGGMGGAGSIPWTSIDRYAERFGFTGAYYQQFHSVMRFLDNKWLSMMHEKQEKERKKSKSGKGASKHSRAPRRR